MRDDAHSSEAVNDTSDGSLRFPQTSWTMVSGAKRVKGDDAKEHLEALAKRYWRPVYLLMRMSVKCPETAKDYAQDFFTHFLERDVVGYADQTRGKFRTFLSASIKRFLAAQYRKTARRREVPADGQGDAPVAEPADLTDPPSDHMKRFAHAFLQSLVEASLRRMERECTALGKEIQFRVFTDKNGLAGATPRSYAQVAHKHGLSVKQVQKRLEKSRRQFARIFRDEVMQTLPDAESIEEEINELLSLIS
jgi:RNA polymerase sigma-70 factor (ECF subfamily)